jgi:hypothetical protein
MHDNTVNCTGNPDAACDNSLSGCTFSFNNGCNHPDAFQAQAGNGVTLVNNVMYGAGCQGIFIAAGSSSDDMYEGTWLIAGNRINLMTQCNSQQHGIAIGGPCDTNGDGSGTDWRECYTGDFYVLYNTIFDSNGFDMGGTGTAVTTRIFSSAFSLTLVGNLFPSDGVSGGAYHFNSGGCVLKHGDNSDVTPTFNKNRLITGGSTCSANDAAGAISMVNTGTVMLADRSNQAAAGASNASVDLSVASPPQTGVSNSGETTYCGSGKDVDDDYDGDVRPLGVACDIGADEAG